MRIRTLIPVNAKPGISLIQVTNPKTGRPARILVPKTAVPGKMVELELPDDELLSKPRANSSSANVDSGWSEQRRNSESRGLGTSKPSSRIGTPPRSDSANAPKQQIIGYNGGSSESWASTTTGGKEEEPLLKKAKDDESKSTGCCSCFSGLCGYVS